MAQIQPARIELSAGGVIFRRDPEAGLQLLLIRDVYGNWGFPKGHIEDAESAADAALRECREETGLTRLTLVDRLGATDWYFRVDGDLIHKFCDYFLLEADPDDAASPQSDEGIQECRWLTADAAVSAITYSNARHFARLAAERATAEGGRAAVGGLRRLQRAHGK